MWILDEKKCGFIWGGGDLLMGDVVENREIGGDS